MMSTVLTNLSSDVLEACSGFFAEVKPQFADQENGESKGAQAWRGIDVREGLQLKRELRSANLGMVHMLLENPLHQLISTRLVSQNDLNERTGQMYIFDDKRPDYRDDGMEWDQSNGMCVKMIVFNPDSCEYRLKNNKKTTGLAVMRRQTFKGADDTASNGWRKHEYKLVLREQLFRPDADGSMSVVEAQRLQQLPVLVHYFFKENTKKGSTRKRKRPDFEHDPSLPNEVKRRAQHTDQSEDVYLQNEGKVTRGLELGPPHLPANSASFPLDPGSLAAALMNDEGSTGCSHSSQSSPDEEGSLDYMDTSPWAVSSWSAPMNSLGCDFFDGEKTPGRPFGEPRSPLPLSAASLGPPLSSHGRIVSYAPDAAPWCTATKMLAVVDGLPEGSSYHCVFGKARGKVTRVCSNVFEVIVPPASCAGAVTFWCVSMVDGRPRYSNTQPFYYTPTAGGGPLQLDFRAIGAHSLQSKREVVSKFRHTVRELDLKDNSLTDLSFLGNMDQLDSLILDNNLLDGTLDLPRLPSLKTLSLNANKISQLEPLLNTLRNSLPSLQYLSLLNNEANPYFSAHSHHYYNFRIYVISCLPNLTHLDATAVTIEELRHATSIMDTGGTPTPPNQRRVFAPAAMSRSVHSHLRQQQLQQPGVQGTGAALSMPTHSHTTPPPVPFDVNGVIVDGAGAFH